MRAKINRSEIRCVAKVLKQGRVIKEYPTTYIKTGYVTRMFKKKLRENPNDPIVDEIAQGEYVIITDGDTQSVTYPVDEFLKLIQDTTIRQRDTRIRVKRSHLKKIMLDGHPVRIFVVDGTPYAVGKDVAHAYGYGGNIGNMINTYLQDIPKMLLPIDDTDFDDYYVSHALNIANVELFSQHYKYLKDKEKRENMSEMIVNEMKNFTNELGESN